MADKTVYKIRITSPDPESAELLRKAWKAIFGDALTLNKARKGSNPKYAHLDQVLAYGELELTHQDLHDAIAAFTQPAYTQETIKLPEPKPRRRKKTA